MKDFLTFFFILLILDLIWIKLRMKYFTDFYRDVQGSELQVKYVYGLLCYIVIAFTLWYFVINKKGTVYEAMLLGAALYAVYDLTNQATLSRWTLKMTVTDIVWGAVLSGVSTYIFVKLKKDSK
jgi:uncharacterized membrane protein